MVTDIRQRLSIDVPIFAFSHCRDVVAAVTNAGGFGVLGATTHSPRALEVDLAWIDAETKGKPYGVDLLLPTTYAKPDADDGGTYSAAARPGWAPSVRRRAARALRDSRTTGAHSRSAHSDQRVT